jgi:hypothetical protein
MAFGLAGTGTITAPDYQVKTGNPRNSTASNRASGRRGPKRARGVMSFSETEATGEAGVGSV